MALFRLYGAVVPDTPIPVAAMIDADYHDFLAQMHLITLEESGLWEVPRGTVDLFNGRRVEHGPWHASDCSRTLLIFLRSGLLGTYEMEWAKPETSRDHHPDESAALLASIDEWTIQRGGYLVPTDLGMATPWQGWSALAPRSNV